MDVFEIFATLQIIIAVLLIVLVLMHSGGRSSGLSGAFGVGGGGALGGGSYVERNLNRWTAFVAVLFVVNTIVLIKI